MSFLPVQIAQTQTLYTATFGHSVAEIDLTWPNPPGPINTVVVLVTVCLHGFNGLDFTSDTETLTDNNGGSYGSPLFWLDRAYLGGPAMGIWVGHPPAGAATIKFTVGMEVGTPIFEPTRTIKIVAVGYNFPLFPTVQAFNVNDFYGSGIRSMTITDSLGHAVQAEIEWPDPGPAASYSDKGWALVDLLVDGPGSDFLIVAGAGSPEWAPPNAVPPDPMAFAYARLVLPIPLGYVTPFPDGRAFKLEASNTVDLHGPFEDTQGFWDQVARPSSPLSLACPSSVAVLGDPYSSSFVASGGTPPYTFAISGGSLPPGLTLNPSTGLVSGTPTMVGTFPYTGQVTDHDGTIKTTNCSITVSSNGTLHLACPVNGGQAFLGAFYQGQLIVTQT